MYYDMSIASSNKFIGKKLMMCGEKFSKSFTTLSMSFKLKVPITVLVRIILLCYLAYSIVFATLKYVLPNGSILVFPAFLLI